MMEPNTATQRPTVVPTLPAHVLPGAAMTAQALRREAEYGCVDWYPYASTLQSRSEWFDYDNGLAVAGVA